MVGVLTNRLARIVDRARTAEARLAGADAEAEGARLRDQLSALARRARLINASITLITIAALFVSLVVALLFTSTLVAINLAVYVASPLFAGRNQNASILRSFPRRRGRR